MTNSITPMTVGDVTPTRICFFKSRSLTQYDANRLNYRFFVTILF